MDHMVSENNTADFYSEEFGSREDHGNDDFEGPNPHENWEEYVSWVAELWNGFHIEEFRIAEGPRLDLDLD